MPKKGTVNNPKGIGGFADNPQNKSTGSWSKNSSVSYWYRYFFSITVEEFKDFQKNNPDKIKLMACEIAYNAVLKCRKDLAYLKELTDRTEGKPQAYMDVTSKDEKINTGFPTLEQFYGKMEKSDE
jgi:hypothetical protein